MNYYIVSFANTISLTFELACTYKVKLLQVSSLVPGLWVGCLVSLASLTQCLCPFLS